MKVKATTKVKATPATKAKATTKVKAAMKLITQGTGHLTFLNMFPEGAGSNNFVKCHICENLVTAGEDLNQF